MSESRDFKVLKIPNVRYFYTERSLSGKDLKLLQRCNENTQRCVWEILTFTKRLSKI